MPIASRPLPEKEPVSPRRSLVTACAVATLALALLGALPTLVAAAPAAGGAAQTDLLDRPRHGEDAIRRLGSNATVAAARNGLTVAELHTKLRDDSTFY